MPTEAATIDPREAVGLFERLATVITPIGAVSLLMALAALGALIAFIRWWRSDAAKAQARRDKIEERLIDVIESNAKASSALSVSLEAQGRELRQGLERTSRDFVDLVREVRRS